MFKSYSELIHFSTFKDRFEYLKLNGTVGVETFGYDRYLNQALYGSYEWRKFRRDIIARDKGCDLGVDGFDIKSRLIVHHINPITLDQIEARDSMIFDPNNVICVSHNTHEAIHYGDESLLPKDPIMRFSGDTKLW